MYIVPTQKGMWCWCIFKCLRNIQRWTGKAVPALSPILEEAYSIYTIRQCNVNVTEFIKLLPSPALAKTSGAQTFLRPADPSFINDTIQLLTHQSTSKRENRWNYPSYFKILYNYFVCKIVSPIVTDVYCSMLRSNLSPKLPTYECCIWYLLYESCYSEAVKPQL